MRRLFSVLLGIAALLAAGFAVFWFFAPVDHYRASIEAAVLKATGRQLRIEGPVNIILVPGVALDLGPVRLSGPGGGDDIVRAANAVAEVEFVPLLGGTVRISRLTLTGADLVIDRRAAPDPERNAVRPNPAPLRLGQIRLVTSRIHLKDAQRDISFGAEDLHIAWPRDAASLSVAGVIELGGERFEVDASTSQPGILVSGEGRLPAKADFEGALAKGSLDGAVDLGSFAFEGLVNLTTPSARRILALYGVVVPGDRGLHSLSIAATLRAQPGRVQLRNAKFTLDATTGGGVFGIKLDRGRLTIAGTVSVDQLDSATYAAFSEPADAAGANGWSEARVDLSGLRTMDLDLQIKAKRANVADIQLANVDAELTSRNGTATLTVTRGAANAGTVAGRLTADATGPEPLIAADFTIRDFDAMGFFTAALGSGALAGRGDLTFRLKGRGASEAELVRNLEGEVRLVLADGALDGIDLPAIARNVASPGAMSGTGTDAATNIRSLAVTFRVAGGVARTDDLRLAAPGLQLQAQGAFGLAARTVRLRLMPDFAAADPGGSKGLSDDAFAMPFAALGPWDAPVFVPDWQALRDRVASGAVSEEDLLRLPEAARAWFAGVIASKAKLPDLPDVPGTAEPAAAPAAMP